MPNIHPTAIVDRNATLADDVTVGPYSIIGPRVTIDKGTRVGAHCVLEGRTVIGRFNRIFHSVMLGQEPQDLKYRGEDALLEIGDHNDIRENVTMHIGTENGGGSTTIGSHNLFMIGTHIAHDCHIGSHSIFANNVLLAGHVDVFDHAVISGGVAISHFVTIGRYAFIGGLSGVTSDCPPFLCSNGHPAAPLAVNTTLLGRHKIDAETIDSLKKCFMLLYGRKAKNFAAGLEEAEHKYGENQFIRELIIFVRNAIDSRNGRALESRRPDDKRSGPTR